MRPEYANAFGLRKVSDKEGQLLEVTLDISYKYMENAITINAQGGIENVATPRRRHGGLHRDEPAERHLPAQPAHPDPGCGISKHGLRLLAGGRAVLSLGIACGLGEVHVLQGQVPVVGVNETVHRLQRPLGVQLEAPGVAPEHPVSPAGEGGRLHGG